MSDYMLIAVPKSGTTGNSSEVETWNTLKANVSGAGTASDLSDIFHFDIPDLRVGTLDKLMAAGDQLSKIDAQVETIIRKVERQFSEVNINNNQLIIDGVPPQTYLESFRWSTAKYHTHRPIEEVIKVIVQHASKVENELKETSTIYQDKRSEMNILQRKKGGNLMVADLDDELNSSLVSQADFIETEYLTTCVVVLSKNTEEDFLSNYESLANDAVGYGPADDRMSVLGSPVVPRSAKRITEDKDGYVLYLVTILKPYLEQFKHAASLCRFTVRNYEYKEMSVSTGQERLLDAEIEYNQARKQLERWCKTHYGEIFGAWIHAKAIRLFVESVLRFGLPVDFLAVLIKPKRNMETKLRGKLFSLYKDLYGADMLQPELGTGGDGAAVGREEFYPYVSFDINVHAKDEH